MVAIGSLSFANGFMYTWVICPNKDDWKKVKCILQDIHSTTDIKRILLQDSYTNMNIFLMLLMHVTTSCLGKPKDASVWGMEHYMEGLPKKL